MANLLVFQNVLISNSTKQINPGYLQFLSNYALFPKNWCKQLVRKEPQI